MELKYQYQIDKITESELAKIKLDLYAWNFRSKKELSKMGKKELYNYWIMHMYPYNF